MEIETHPFEDELVEREKKLSWSNGGRCGHIRRDGTACYLFVGHPVHRADYSVPEVETPDAVVMAGDWHGNTKHATSVISQLPELLPHEESPTIIQVGDFGLWEPFRYVMKLNEALNTVNGQLMFIDGNHENHTLLSEYQRKDKFGRIRIANRIRYLPRNHRWTWHGRTWLALGGATSVDRALRTEGFDVFAAEELTDEQLFTAAYEGACEVMVTHDAPSLVPLLLPPPSPLWAPRDLARADVHRERLSGLVETISPSLLIHGHYHVRQNWSGKTETGSDLRVVSLDMDGTPGNIVVVDTKTLEVS